MGGSATKSTVPEVAPGSTPNQSHPTEKGGVEKVLISRIQPCSFQPRKMFTEESLAELADSIREQGIIQPLLVRSRGSQYELIAGERRWRAAQRAGLTEVPVLVRDADDREVLELALIENLQRENLNPLEEAQGYSQLVSQFGLTQEETAVRVGKNRSVVANSLRLLRLPAEVQNFLRDGRMTVGHAKAILGLPRADDQLMAAQKILRSSLNVRQTESMVAEWEKTSGSRGKGKGSSGRAGDPNVADLENRIREKVGTRVELRYAQGKGTLQIKFFSDDELQRILELLGVARD